MIHCRPRRILLWDYDIEGDGHRAHASVNWVGEQGTLHVDGADYVIDKHGLTSGMWTMEQPGSEYAVAQKIWTATRRFEIQAPSGLLTMRPMSPIKRSFVLERSGDIVGTIKHNHPFTRRAKIDLSPREDDFHAVCFAFWLAVLTWKRRRRAGS